jgi:hypothetical protein
VKKDDRRTGGGAGFGVASIQNAGIDLLQGAKRRIRPGPDGGQVRRRHLAGLGVRRPDHAEPGSGNRHRRRAQKPAAIRVDIV